jgi:hypothetical protein
MDALEDFAFWSIEMMIFTSRIVDRKLMKFPVKIWKVSVPKICMKIALP